MVLKVFGQMTLVATRSKARNILNERHTSPMISSCNNELYVLCLSHTWEKNTSSWDEASWKCLNVAGAVASWDWFNLGKKLSAISDRLRPKTRGFSGCLALLCLLYPGENFVSFLAPTNGPKLPMWSQSSPLRPPSFSRKQCQNCKFSLLSPPFHVFWKSRKMLPKTAYGQKEISMWGIFQQIMEVIIALWMYTYCTYLPKKWTDNAKNGRPLWACQKPGELADKFWSMAPCHYVCTVPKKATRE